MAPPVFWLFAYAGWMVTLTFRLSEGLSDAA